MTFIEEFGKVDENKFKLQPIFEIIDCFINSNVE